MSPTHASPELYWLPARPETWRQRVSALADLADRDPAAWTEAVALARYRLDFSGVNALDRATRRLVRPGTASFDPGGVIPSVRLAILSSSTTTHLHGAIRVGGLRQVLAIEVYEPDYGQYRQVLAAPRSPLVDFAPDVVVFAFDAVTVASQARAAASQADAKRLAEAYVAQLKELWATARARTGAAIIQQTVMPRFAAAGGSNEHRLPGSPAAFVARVNALLRDAVDDANVDLLALDARVSQDGVDRWFGAAQWHGARQEVSLPAAPMYGDLLARLLAARLGRSSKCCVFDLDNTLWGGVIGDDGLQGIVLGAGSAAGEAFLDLQHYALALRRRGILLAVCSKNDAATAVEPFDRHPEMALKRSDIACFVANWDDKASNLQQIARTLSIGLESLVFIDDNPFERELVRRALPEVFVPEVPEDPALVARCIADAGCFEAVSVTAEDAMRAELYADNARREARRSSATDLDGYLADLDMTLHWGAFAESDVARVTQLINKTNQFNLATRRLSEGEVRAIMADPRAVGLRFRLVDRFGDNGVIAVVTGHMADDETFVIDDWLMSCRVLGRHVEAATLNALVEAARRLGATRIAGRYRPTGKNGLVADLLPRLGFSVTEDGHGALDLHRFAERPAPMRSVETTGAR
jgi:FkbH-like protein